MSWTQLGLFLERSLPTRINRDKPSKKPSKSKPIRKAPPKGVKLAEGELDDDISDIFGASDD